VPLVDRQKIVGAVLGARQGVRPVFVSPGHRVDVAGAVRLTLACTDRYRLPEPSRTAHRLASAR
jgi:deoxyribonuclease V